MDEETRKTHITIAIWITVAFLFGLIIYQYFNIETIKTSPCKVCEDRLGQICRPKLGTFGGASFPESFNLNLSYEKK